MAHSIFVPIGYVILVFGSLYLFSSWYRKRTTHKYSEPYFLSHSDRDVYVTLLGRTNPPANDALLKSALLRRAIADVQRVLKIREDKPALQNLLQKGLVGDELWNSLLAAERELEAEILEVMAEANTFVDGWGSVIFQTANEMIANEKMRSLFEQSHGLRAEKEQKYGKSKTIDAQVPTPQAVSSSLAALPSGPASNVPSITKPLNGNSEATSSASTDTPTIPPTDHNTTSKSPKSSGKKAKKRK
jgi:translocation protein SEC66